ncbi:S1 RNA-binding domain-containing protein [Malaciobacter mytili]|uniref:DNA-binding protein n=1 Tax=Malaciobacter mytili LMG 24559 TaxID=1032238 RepID=A0AAX2AF16_9BACT|nr:S1-like domain-containing RNA-binding protein [Malaciobacter mytili]AXH14244.1 putative RNA-binding protein (S1 domain) [Malaciobacter mytili LMG 24559]RXI48777.1 DNA-binding protein [Malaciobacter mytili]RXK15314.1 DNA-binding protein [Malaciobacter mytili LMG 24559]
MNEKIKLGEINTLEISRVSEPGLYLKSLDNSEVLLPNVYIKQEMQLGQEIEVFIYTDSEDRLVATTIMPKAKINEIALLEVVDIAKFGAFVDLGLPKDLLVPKNKQKSPFQIGEKRLVKVIEDEKSHRLIGVEKFQEKFNRDLSNFQRNDEVQIIVYKKTPLGFKVYVNSKFEGMIYHTEIFTKINIGDKKTAYIKTVRDDGKLDISLQKIAQDNSNDDTLKIIEVLKINNNELKITSKSDPEKIIELFEMSKKRFKAALNSLINDNIVVLEEDKILLKA